MVSEGGETPASAEGRLGRTTGRTTGRATGCRRGRAEGVVGAGSVGAGGGDGAGGATELGHRVAFQLRKACVAERQLPSHRRGKGKAHLGRFSTSCSEIEDTNSGRLLLGDIAIHELVEDLLEPAKVRIPVAFRDLFVVACDAVSEGGRSSVSLLLEQQ